MTAPSFPVLDHLLALTDDTGLIQHATRDIPNRATGYCTDDIARGLIVAVDAARNPATAAAGKRLVTTYLAFLHDAQLHDGWFHNFMGYDRSWQDRRGSSDAFGRALWGLGYCMRFASRESWRRTAQTLFMRARPQLRELEHHRSRAYTALGVVHALQAQPGEAAGLLGFDLAALLEPLVADLAVHGAPEWMWCEPQLTYDNARLPQALIRGGEVLHDRKLTVAGLRMLDFYLSVVLENGVFVPVGNDGWYPRDGRKARFGQQPIEAAGLIDAALAAFDATGDARYLRAAESAFGWFWGANSASAELVVDGGCSDGIDAAGVNSNMGAESTLAYLQSAIALARPSAARLLETVR